uniref:HD domain-containing protein n=1 Tax=Amphimedon queenslandica TaxID=400682 RepID=A0A1X7UMP0_AMPQE
MAEKDSDSLTEERKQEEQECIPNLFTFFKLCSKLKHLKRTGWVNHNVKEPETVAGHMYRMSLMSFLFSKDNSIDYNKCVKMSLVHDLAESIVGDLTPSCNVSKEEKHQREKDAMVKISELVPKEVGQELYSLWTVRL